MKRVVIIGLAALACAVSFLAGAAVALDVVSRRTAHLVQLREAQWTKALNREVRVGELKSEVEAWVIRKARPRLGEEIYSAEERKFFVIADTIQDAVGFPCSEWYVASEVSVGPDDRVVSRRVVTTGSCL